MANKPVSGGDQSERGGPSRRTVLRGIGVAGLLSTLGVGQVGGVTGQLDAEWLNQESFFEVTRPVDAYGIRTSAAKYQYSQPQPNYLENGDETRYDGYFAMFTKGLPHDEYGEVSPAAYETLLAALRGDVPYDDIPLGGDRKFVSPQAAQSYAMVGPDPQHVGMQPAPRFDSPEMAAEVVELYWQALLRDVPFHDYDDNPLAEEAAAELSELTAFTGPRASNSKVTPNLLFRGSQPGNLAGPYLSQFFYHPIPRGDILEQAQRYRVYRENLNFMTDYDEWLRRTNGEDVFPEVDRFERQTRYLLTGRDLATYVHLDYGIQAYTDAALILLGQFYGGGVNLDPNVPLYDSRTQDGFVDFGDHDILSLVGGVLQPSQRAAWVHKWLVNRRLRPEVYGGRIHNHRFGHKEYPLRTELLNSPSLTKVYDRYGTYLLPQVYPEGSPTHPAYPAGHAAIAGACGTVLKAFFDESSRLTVYAPSANGSRLERQRGYLRVGDELNKLALNMCIGRNWAGIHYRSDADHGILLGEKVAIGYLADLARTYDEAYGFDGFSFQTFDGRQVRVTPEGAVPA